ncbi:hypothetical protein Ddye_024500 [Dipteronia dyeriana]|uniref:Uncharacterized protein n=1 Tax=Dipteronia dyeriana TaxID=168575 RepID=A0AAD9WUA9_9ROSI|nr:hypothetical protein Ddye_024500 [Dipteronia dyeriana]
MKTKEDLRSIVESSDDFYSEEEEEEDNVLGVAGCKSCFMYFMVPKQVKDCPICNGQLLHFVRSDSWEGTTNDSVGVFGCNWKTREWFSPS